MTNIRQEDLERARIVVATCSTKGITNTLRESLISEIAKALADQREADAKIAEEHWKTMTKNPEKWPQGIWKDSSERIARAILNG